MNGMIDVRILSTIFSLSSSISVCLPDSFGGGGCIQKEERKRICQDLSRS